MSFSFALFKSRCFFFFWKGALHVAKKPLDSLQSSLLLLIVSCIVLWLWLIRLLVTPEVCTFRASIVTVQFLVKEPQVEGGQWATLQPAGHGQHTQLSPRWRSRLVSPELVLYIPTFKQEWPCSLTVSTLHVNDHKILVASYNKMFPLTVLFHYHSSQFDLVQGRSFSGGWSFVLAAMWKRWKLCP